MLEIKHGEGQKSVARTITVELDRDELFAAIDSYCRKKAGRQVTISDMQAYGSPAEDKDHIGVTRMESIVFSGFEVVRLRWPDEEKADTSA